MASKKSPQPKRNSIWRKARSSGRFFLSAGRPRRASAGPPADNYNMRRRERSLAHRRATFAPPRAYIFGGSVLRSALTAAPARGPLSEQGRDPRQATGRRRGRRWRGRDAAHCYTMSGTRRGRRRPHDWVRESLVQRPGGNAPASRRGAMSRQGRRRHNNSAIVHCRRRRSAFFAAPRPRGGGARCSRGARVCVALG